MVFDHYILKSGFTRIFQDMDEIPVNEADSYEAKAFAAFGYFEELGDKELQVRLLKSQVLQFSKVGRRFVSTYAK